MSPDLMLLPTPNHMRVGTGQPPILRCSGCQAPVRSATTDEVAAVLLCGDEQLPDPIDDCMFCAPARRRAGDVERARAIAETALVGPVRPVFVGGRVVQLTVQEADALMRALARTIWVMTGDPSPLEEESYSAGWDDACRYYRPRPASRPGATL